MLPGGRTPIRGTVALKLNSKTKQHRANPMPDSSPEPPKPPKKFSDLGSTFSQRQCMKLTKQLGGGGIEPPPTHTLPPSDYKTSALDHSATVT